MELPRFTLVLPAAGSSVRFGSNKLLAKLGGEPVIARTLSAFLDHPSLAAIVVAASQPNAIRQAAVKVLKRAEEKGVIILFAPGGETRAHSVKNAVEASPAEIEWIAVHDGARPLVSRELIDRTLLAAAEHGAAAPAMPVTLTIKQTDERSLPAAVARTLPRATLWAMQTPQIVRRQDLLDATANCPIPLSAVTDDLQLIELAGKPSWLVSGEDRNLKLTNASDLALAEAFLRHDREAAGVEVKG